MMKYLIALVALSFPELTLSKTFATDSTPPIIMNGFLIHDIEWKAAHPIDPKFTEENDLEGTPDIKLDENVPQVIEPRTEQTARLNDALRIMADSIWTKADGPKQSDVKKDKDGINDLDLAYLPNTEVLAGVISLEIDMSFYTHGAAHGGEVIQEFNWNISQNRYVNTEDIFKPDTNWQSKLISALEKAFPDYVQDDLNPNIYDVSDPRNWAILRDGLQLNIGSGVICALVCPVHPVLVPWTILKPFLQPNGLVKPI